MGSQRARSGWRRLLVLVAAAVAITSSALGQAAPVRGLLRLAKADESVSSGGQGYWRGLRNPTLPIAPPAIDLRRSMVVAIEGSGLGTKSNVVPQVVLEDAQVTPPVLPVRPGTKVTFENRDWQLHLLEPRGAAKFIKAQSIDPGDKLSHTFDKPGCFELRCSEVPHLRLTVLVTTKAQFTLPDNTGAFRFPDIRPGTYELKVWHRGKWIHSQPLTVRGKTTADIQLPPLQQVAGESPAKRK